MTMDHSTRSFVLSTPQGYAWIEENDGVLEIIYKRMGNAKLPGFEDLCAYKYSACLDSGQNPDIPIDTSQCVGSLREMTLLGASMGSVHAISGDISVSTITGFMTSLMQPISNPNHCGELTQGETSLKGDLRSPIRQSHDEETDGSNHEGTLTEAKPMVIYTNQSSVTMTECSDTDQNYLNPIVNPVLDVLINDGIDGITRSLDIYDSAGGYPGDVGLELTDGGCNAQDTCAFALNPHSGRTQRWCTCKPISSRDCISRKRRVGPRRSFLQSIMSCLQHKAG